MALRAATTLPGSIVTAQIADGAVTNAKLANMPGASLKGNSGAPAAVPQDLTLDASLTFSGSTVKIATAGVSNAMLANVATSTIKGRTTAGTGVPQDLTAAQAAAIIGAVGGALKSKLVSVTRDISTASGNQAVTGVGFVPTAVFLFCSVNTVAGVSLGFADSALGGGSVIQATDAATVFGVSTNAIYYGNQAGSTGVAGTIGSYDSDGFTIAWTKLGSPTGTLTIKALCFR